MTSNDIEKITGLLLDEAMPGVTGDDEGKTRPKLDDALARGFVEHEIERTRDQEQELVTRRMALPQVRVQVTGFASSGEADNASIHRPTI